LKTSDAYESAWLGIRESKEPEVRIGGDGRFAIGIQGRSGGNLDTLGLMLVHDPAAKSEAAKPKKLPTPRLAALADARDAVQEQYKADLAKAKGAKDKALLAQKLQEKSRGAQESALPLALLEEAAKLSAQAGDLDTLLQVVDDLADRFEGDFAPLKKESLTSLVAAAKDTPAGRAAAAWLVLLDKPDDPVANHTAGIYECFLRDRLPTGLPLLLKSTVAGESAAAKKDSENPTDSAEQIAAGDAWWDLSEKETDRPIQHALRERAAFWYEKAIGLASGTNKTKLEKRIGIAKGAR
jgi:hypothetical protein